MKKGDYLYTPRFCHVEIKEIFDCEEDARKAGYTEPTFYESADYGINGKSIGLNHMVFAGYRRES